MIPQIVKIPYWIWNGKLYFIMLCSKWKIREYHNLMQKNVYAYIVITVFIDDFNVFLCHCHKISVKLFENTIFWPFQLYRYIWIIKIKFHFISKLNRNKKFNNIDNQHLSNDGNHTNSTILFVKTKTHICTNMSQRKQKQCKEKMKMWQKSTNSEKNEKTKENMLISKITYVLRDLNFRLVCANG